MPRLNVERTNEMKAELANDTFIRENFGPNTNVNDGWAVDTVMKTYTSKVYGHGYVTTQMEPPFTTTFQED